MFTRTWIVIIAVLWLGGMPLSPSYGQLLNKAPVLEFEHYDTEAGLLSSSVFDVVQDSLGYMWLATELALTRFDGQEMINYARIPGDSASMADDFLSDLFIDRDGMLWVSSFRDSLMRFDPVHNTFETLKISSFTGIARQGVQHNKIMQDSEGMLWVATVDGEGLLKVDPGLMSFERLLPDSTDRASQSVFSRFVYSVVEDDAGWLWVGFVEGAIDRINVKTGEIQPFVDSKGKRIFTIGHDFNELYFDSEGQLWAGTGEGLEKYNTDLEKFERVSILNTHKDPFAVQKILADGNGAFWLCTYDKGLVYYEPETGIAGLYQHDVNDKASIGNNEVKNGFIDHSGNLWLATLSALSKADLNRKPFGVINQSADENSLTDNNIYDITEDDRGNLWVATNYGLNKVEKATGRIQQYFHDENNPQAPSEDKIWSINYDSKDSLWIGYQDAGVDIVSGEEEHWENLSVLSKHTEAAANTVYILHEDRYGRIFIGTSQGLVLYERDSGDMTFLSHNKFIPGSVVSVVEDKHGVLWLGSSSKGLYSLDLQTLEPGSHLTMAKNGIADDNIYCLLIDKDNYLWIGTSLGLSVVKLNEDGKLTGKIYTYTKQDGLANNTLVEMQEDAAGDVWAATGNGLTHIKKEIVEGELALTFRNYDQKDGLASEMFYIGPSHKDEEGMLYFGGSKGVVFFDPLKITDNSVEPRMAITNIALFNKDLTVGKKDAKGRVLLSKSTSYMDKLQLNYTDRVLTLSFAAMHYSQPEKNRYRYRLAGFQDEWLETSSIRQATYTNLPGGTYTFEVIGSNLDGVWSQEPARLSIVVAPPFWETWWFRISVSLFVVLSFAGFYWYRTRAIRKQNQVLEQKVAERTEELNSKNVLLEDANIELTVLNDEVNAKNYLLEEANIELEVQRDELHQALETNKEILGITVHDLKNPLGGVIGLSELIIEDTGQLTPKDISEEVKENAQMLKVEAEHMLQSIKDMLDKYRGEHEEQPRREQADLTEVLVNVVRWNQKTADDKEIALINTNKDPVPVQIDVVEIQRAMDNFISNAIKYSPAGTEVQLLLEIKDEVVRFTVKDQGPGLTEEDLGKVFGKMQQLSAKPTAGEHSTGLGLYSAKELVEHHGGQVGVDSVYGEGAAFWFELPLVAPVNAYQNLVKST